jgi:hypothetical protein
MANMVKNHKFYYLDGPESAANNVDSDSDIIDTANFEGCVFITSIIDSVQGGVATMTVEQNTANSSSGMAALSADAVATATSAASDDLNNKLLIVDVYRPRERYLRVNRTSATQNIAFGDVVAILYGPRKMPITQATAEVADSDTAVSVAEA